MNLAAAFSDLGLSWTLLCALSAGMFAVGVVLLLWGWMVHRALLVLIGCGAGYLLGWPLAARFDWPVLITQGSLAVVLAILLACFARIVWALVLAVILASLVGGVVLHLNWSDVAEKAGTPPELHEDQQLDEYVKSCREYSHSAWKALWDQHYALLIAAASASGAMGLLIGLILARFTRILMTSLIGADLVVCGALLGLITARSELLSQLLRYRYVPSLVSAGLLIVGMVVQYRSALAAEREEQGEEASPVEKRKKAKSAGEAE